MKAKSNKIGRFWQELIRRRVIHVITVYASAAFVILELINNLGEPLNLPENLATIVIIVLAIGFPITSVLSWFYDFKGEGMEKTKPLSEIREEEEITVPNAWKIATYVSFAVIIGLVTFNILGGSKQLRAGDIQSLMILPFDNYTGDDQLDDFISGLHSTFINDIGRIRGLTVKSKTTSNAYKDKPVSEIAEEQGVEGIVTTTVMCLADSICFQLKLITPEGEERWISDNRESLSQLSNLNNKITREMAEEVHIKLSDETVQILAESRTADPEAIKAYHRGLSRLESFEIGAAIEFFNRAIAIDPDWAPPYAGLSRVWTNLRFFGAVPDSIARPQIYTNLNRALELEPNSAESYYVLAGTETWTEWNWKKGEEAFIRTIELNPNDAVCRLFYAHLLMIQRRQKEAVDQAKVGLKLDPQNPLILSLYAVVMMNEGDYESAIAYFEEALSINPNFGYAKANLSVALFDTGEYERWFDFWNEAVCWEEEIKIQFRKVFDEKGMAAAIEELFLLDELYGKPGCQMTTVNKMDWYLKLNDFEQALDCMEQLFEASWTNFPYISTNHFKYDQLIAYPRYIKILREMNLPQPEA